MELSKLKIYSRMFLKREIDIAIRMLNSQHVKNYKKAMKDEG